MLCLCQILKLTVDHSLSTSDYIFQLFICVRQRQFLKRVDWQLSLLFQFFYSPPPNVRLKMKHEIFILFLSKWIIKILKYLYHHRLWGGAKSYQPNQFPKNLIQSPNSSRVEKFLTLIFIQVYSKIKLKKLSVKVITSVFIIVIFTCKN